MRDIHPEIKKFWEDADYEVNAIRPSAILNNQVWVLVWSATKKDDIFSSVSVAITETIGGPTGRCEEICKIYYVWNNKAYCEDEMLRIIKQKAFL